MIREPPATLVWVVATFLNITASAFNSEIAADPIAIAWMRLAVGAVSLAVLARGIRRVRLSRELVVMGACIAGMNAAFYVVVPRIGLGLAVALGLVGPIAVAAGLARARRDLVSILLAVAGIAAMARPWQGEADLVGVAVALAGGAGWAVFILAGRRAGPAAEPSHAALAFLAIAALLLTPPAIAGGGFPVTDTRALVTIVLGGAVGGGIAFWAEMYSMGRLPTRSYSVLQAGWPAIGVIVGVVVLGDRPTAIALAGVACVSLAAALAIQQAPVSAERARDPGTRGRSRRRSRPPPARREASGS